MKIYLVGGAVRNTLLKIPVVDRDWVVVGGTPEQLLKKRFKQVGKNFPVFLHPITHEEYALARIESKFGVGHQGFKVNYSPHVTLKEDLIRRDLTINAIAQDNNGNYFDPFNGIKDIKSKILRHISSSFSEDPLRVLRVARFSASLFHLGFKIAHETMELMIKIINSREILYLNANRIWKETEKALKTKNPHVFFQILHHCNAFSIIFPELNKIILMQQNVYVFCVLDTLYQKIFKSLAIISQKTDHIDIKFAYLCQTISFLSNCTTYNMLLYNNLFTIKIINKFFKRLNIPNDIKILSNLIIKNQWFLYTIQYQSSELIIKLFYSIDAWRKPIRIDKLSFLINQINIKNNFCYFKNKLFNPGEYLKKIFNVASNVSIKNVILYDNIHGSEIHKKYVQLRISAIDQWRLKNF